MKREQPIAGMIALTRPQSSLALLVSSVTDVISSLNLSSVLRNSLISGIIILIIDLLIGIK